MVTRWKLWLPLIAFVALLALIGSRLVVPPDTQVKSALVGKPLPEFALRGIVQGKPGLTSADLATGKPRRRTE